MKRPIGGATCDCFCSNRVPLPPDQTARNVSISGVYAEGVVAQICVEVGVLRFVVPGAAMARRTGPP